MPDYDLVIIGAGCAGLALGRALAELPSNQTPRTLLLDGRSTYSDDRSWSFWAPPKCGWGQHARASWPSWCFGRKNKAVAAQNATGIKYYCLRAIDYYGLQLSRIDADPRVKLQRKTRVRSSDWRDGRFIVETDRGRVTSRHVVDTRAPQSLDPTLWQQFSGFEVRTSGSCFDPRAAGLMLDMDCDQDGFIFTYLLPFAKDHALIEATRFGATRLPRSRLRVDALKALERNTGGRDSELLREESGCLPMGYWPDVRAARGEPIRAGAGAGALRSASGYGFLRMQNWARRCSEALVRKGAPISHPMEPVWRKAMDRRFLQVISNQPSLAPFIFDSMARGMDGRRFARFMSDTAGPLDIMAMIASLPKRPFLQPTRRSPYRYATARAACR